MRYLLDLQHWLLIFGGWAFADGFGRYNILNFGSSNAISGPATRCSKGQQCSRLGYIAASYGSFDDDYDYDDYDGSEYMNDYERDLDADEFEKLFGFSPIVDLQFEKAYDCIFPVPDEPISETSKE